MRRAIRAWLLLFPLLLGGCFGGEGEEYETVSFTANDAAEVSAFIDQLESGSSLPSPAPAGAEGQEGSPEVVLDASQAQRFTALRSGVGEALEGSLRVTNAFANVRATPSVQAEKIGELTRGDRVTLLSFPDAAWAEVELPDGRRGSVAASYVAQLATEEMLPALKKKYEGLFYVNFAFLNVRSAPETKSQKLGELRSRQIVKPLSFHGEWARIPFDGKEGYVSAQYLKPFAPPFIVRQERFSLPILRYRGDEAQVADTLVKHLALLKGAGRKMLTLQEFRELLLRGEERDERLPPGAVILAVSDVTSQSVRDIADALRATGVRATLFLKTSDIGPQGILPQFVQTLSANGNDVQSAGHSGEDLRALTNTQIALDLQQSRQILEDLSGRDVFAIAYPGGGVNDRIVEQAIDRGYLFGVTLAAGSTFDRSEFLRLPSNLVSPSTPEQTLKALVGVLP